MSDRPAADLELQWDAPPDGVWWLTREHFPAPVCRVFAAIFPPVTDGWVRGGERFGIPVGRARWAVVNGWVYYGADAVDPSTFSDLEVAARETLATQRWRAEVRDWVDVQRPGVVAANLELQSIDPHALDDTALAELVDATIVHFHAVAPLHFEHTGFDIAGGLLFEAARDWGVGASEVAALLQGASPASTGALAHIDRIVDALGGVSAKGVPASIDAVRMANPTAARAVDDYLDEYGWRLLDGHDLSGPTLIERPVLVVSALRARADATRAPEPTEDPAISVRARLPEHERARFDTVVADARASYRLRDDDGGVCFSWPLGLVRRAVLEAGHRLATRGTIDAPGDAFEAEPAELTALLAGAGPSAPELRARADVRARAARTSPPGQLGAMPSGAAEGPLPETVARLAGLRDLLWSAGGAAATDVALTGTGVGSGRVRGRVCILDAPEAFDRLEPGDVIVAMTTTSTHNSVFPIAAAVVTETGGLFSHAAILARELELPAVVGVTGLLAEVHDGDLLEVDAAAGAVRILESQRAPVKEPDGPRSAARP